MLLCSVPFEFSRNVILKANIPGWVWLLSGMSALCSKTLQVLTAPQGHPKEVGLERKLIMLWVYSCACIARVFQTGQTKRMALGVWRGQTCLLIALGPVLALLPQKPEIHSLVLFQQLERLHVHSHPGTLCASYTSFPEDSRPGVRSPRPSSRAGRGHVPQSTEPVSFFFLSQRVRRKYICEFTPSRLYHFRIHFPHIGATGAIWNWSGLVNF